MFNINNKLQKKLNKIYDFYGEKLQQEKLIEENEELKTAIINKNRENYIEEMADSFVVWMQLFLNISRSEKHKLLKTVKDKTNRTLKRIEKIKSV